MQNGRWKQLCRINCDVANIFLLFQLPKRRSSRRNSFCCLPRNFPPTYENMTGNNNRWVFKWRLNYISQIRKICIQFSFSCFQMAMVQLWLRLLFITVMCNVACVYLLAKPRFATEFICSKPADGNAPFPFCKIFQSFLKVHFTDNGEEPAESPDLSSSKHLLHGLEHRL